MTPPAISSSVAILFNGVLLLYFFMKKGFWFLKIPPGAIALTLTLGDKVVESHLVNWIKPALEIAYPAGLFILVFEYVLSGANNP